MKYTIQSLITRFKKSGNKEARYFHKSICVKLYKKKDNTISITFYTHNNYNLKSKLGTYPNLTLDNALFMSSPEYSKRLITVYTHKRTHYDSLLSINTLDRYDKLFKHLTHLHNTQIDLISRKDVIAVCTKLYKDNKLDTAKRVYSLIKSLFNYALSNELIDNTTSNPFSIPLSYSFRFPKSDGLCWIETKDDLLHLIDYLLNIKSIAKDKLILNLFLALRVGNLKLDLLDYLKEDYLHFPKSVMKNHQDFYLGLTPILYAYIKRIGAITLNEATINKALRDFTPTSLLGANKHFTNHSFRKVFATFSKDFLHTEDIDITLAHNVGSTTTRVYMKSTHLSTTRKAIRLWQEYLFSLDSRLRDYIG